MIVVDDGLATGSSMLAAVQALRDNEPAAIVVAVPAAPESTCREFAAIVDEVVRIHAHAVPGNPCAGATGAGKHLDRGRNPGNLSERSLSFG